MYNTIAQELHLSLAKGRRMMKATRYVLFLCLLAISSMGSAQASGALKSFNDLKALSGSWQGRVTAKPEAPEVQGKMAHVTLRTTSMGNALMHEMRIQGRDDDPITMLYMNDNHLQMTHFCDAGNRPRMIAKTSADGKTVEFSFVDITGSTQYGHMEHAVFTMIDANHHTEDWTYMSPDNKPVTAHFDLQREQ